MTRRSQPVELAQAPIDREPLVLRRAPGAPPPGWAHHKAVPKDEQQDEKGAADHIPDNGKVERPHSSNQEEFRQLLTYKDDIDPEPKLEEWERFYNLSRPYGAFKGKTPYEALRERL